MKKLLASLAVVAALAYGQARCPYDGDPMGMTGRTDGKGLWEYRCPSGHTAWGLP